MIRFLRTAAVHVALAAMLLRALTPAGWMPDTTGKAGTPLVICTMNGPAVMSPAADGTTAPAKHQREACPFAATPHLALATGAVALALPSEAPAPARLPTHRAVAATVARHSPQSPRAPPLFA